MIDDPRSLIFTDSFEMMISPMIPNSPSLQTLEGLWWKHESGVEGSVSLTNTTHNSVKVSVRAIGAHGFRFQKGDALFTGLDLLLGAGRRPEGRRPPVRERFQPAVENSRMQRVFVAQVRPCHLLDPRPP